MFLVCIIVFLVILVNDFHHKMYRIKPNERISNILWRIELDCVIMTQDGAREGSVFSVNEETKKQILQKNRRMIDMIIERAKRDFPDDIALIGLTGSFSTGDFHEKSDLDLIIVNQTERGWEIAAGFILDDVGYDIYCTPWEPRILAQSRLESPMASCLVDLQILYCAKPEHLETFNRYRQNALDLLAQPIGEACLDRAEKNIGAAKKHYAEAMLSDEIGAVKYAAGCVLFESVNALTNMNNSYIKRGVKRYLEQVLGYPHRPEDYESLYMAVIEAGTIDQARAAARNLLAALMALLEDLRARYVQAPSPTYDSLRGTYEELWCNCRNKVLASVEANDPAYAFHAALGAQSYLDEMAQMFGTPRFNLMRHFDVGDLDKFRLAFLDAMDDYAAIYERVGRKIERYDSFEQMYDAFMNGRMGR